MGENIDMYSGFNMPKHRLERSDPCNGHDFSRGPRVNGTGTFTLEVEYFNYTQYHIQVTGNDDVPMVIYSDPTTCPDHKNYLNHVIICYNYKVRYGYLNDFHRHVNSQLTAETPLMRSLQIQVNKDYPFHQSQMTREYKIAFKIHIEKILNSPQGIFDENTSKVLSVNIPEDSRFVEVGAPNHINPVGLNRVNFPAMSAAGLTEEEKEKLDSTMIAFHADLIDNGNVMSSRFFKLLDQVIELKPRLDLSRPSGLYIYYRSGTSLRGSRITDMQFFKLDEISEEMGFYRKREDTLSSLELKKLHLEKEKIRTENERLEIEREVLKIKQDIDMSSAEVKREQIQHDKEKMKAAKNPSAWEKTVRVFSEVGNAFKAAAAFIGGALALYKVYEMTKSK